MSNANTSITKPRIIAAFMGLYLFWGSTYLVIMYAIRTIPPFFLVATRFFISGMLLLVWCLNKGEKLPSAKSLVPIASSGILMLFVGNSAVSWSEQYLPSGLAAIIVATVPLWFILLDKRNWHYHFTNKGIVLGVLIGFAGVFMLFSGKGSNDFTGDPMKLVAFFVLLLGCMGWAIGSLYSKYKESTVSVTMKVALQMLAASLVALPVAFISGEHHDLILANISSESLWALVYLTIFGSLVGFMSYIWLLNALPASLVGTYAYVNPVVAVFLGWLILDEHISSGQVWALAVILLGVILVNFTITKKVKT